MTQEPFVIERTIDAPVEKVWQAITDKDVMKQWYFNVPAFKPEIGCEFTFEGGKDGRIYTHVCTITEVVPFQKLTHTWTYKGYEGVSYVSFELTSEGDKTRVKLTHSGMERFASNNNPDFSPGNFAEGWTYIIGKGLPTFLEKQKSQA